MPMTNEQFAAVAAGLYETADGILAVKGPDYAGHGDDNRLANFETIAELLRGAPMDSATIAAVYWLKHIFAICTYIRNRKPGSEPLEGRFADERNYNLLLWACLLAAKEVDIQKVPITELTPEECKKLGLATKKVP